jgi:GTP-binding protein LepA
VVFCGLFPVDAADFEDLRDALGKLRLNDASFSYEMETSPRSASASAAASSACCTGDHPGAPRARVQPRPHHDRAERGLQGDLTTDGDARSSCTTPGRLPDVVRIEEIEEPWIKATIHARRVSRRVLKLCQDRRGSRLKT